MAYSPYPSRYGRFSHPWPVDQSSRYAPSHPGTPLPGGYPHPAQGAHPATANPNQYTIQDYLRSLGYGSQAGYLQGLGLNAQPYTPMSDADIQAKAKAMVDAQINPLLERLNTEYAGRAKMGSEAIQSLTQMLAGMAAQYGPSVGKAYDEAIGQGQQLATGLADRLSGAGQGAAQEAGGKLAAAGQDTSGASGLGDVGKFAGDAGFAKDTSALEALNAGKAADMAYGAKLPFIEGLTGAQQGQAFQSQLMAALGQDTASVTGQVPGLLQSIAESLMAQDQGKQDRSTAATQARAQAQLGLQQDYVAAKNRRQDISMHNTERAQSLAAQKRAEAENQRRYNVQQAEIRQQRQDTLSRQRLSIVAADAPTTRGRKAYWDAQAAARTRDTGTEYIGTPTGIRPVAGPGGKPVQTQTGKFNQTRQQQADLATIVQWGTDAHGQWTPEGRKAAAKLLGHDPGQYPPGYKPKAPVKLEVVGSDKAGRWLVNPVTGKKVVQVTGRVSTPTKPGQPHTVRGSDGRYWTISPDGKTATPVKGPPPAPPKSAAPHKTLVVGSDKSGRYLVDSTTGRRIAVITPPEGGTSTPPRYLHGADGRWYLVSPDGKTAVPVKGPPAGKTSGSSSGGPPKSFKRH